MALGGAGLGAGGATTGAGSGLRAAEGLAGGTVIPVTAGAGVVGAVGATIAGLGAVMMGVATAAMGVVAGVIVGAAGAGVRRAGAGVGEPAVTETSGDVNGLVGCKAGAGVMDRVVLGVLAPDD